MRHRVRERLQLPVGRLQLRGALLHPLFKAGIKTQNFALLLLALGNVAPGADDELLLSEQNGGEQDLHRKSLPVGTAMKPLEAVAAIFQRGGYHGVGLLA